MEVASSGTAYVRMMRPKQWVKNGFVLAPLVFSQQLMQSRGVERSVEAFLCWCAVSSGIYIFNDLFDREADRRHPAKCMRPLASGEVRPPAAALLAAVLLTGGLGGLFTLGSHVLVPAALYAAINLAYSAYLKQVVIVDVMAIASGFVLRVIGGAEAIDAWVSPWLVLCTALLALFLGFEKRRGEQVLLELDAEKHRAVLTHYSSTLLNQLISVLTASTVLSYALYTISEETVAKFGTNKLFLTVPFVLYGIFRYLYVAHQKGQGGSPTEIVFRDRPLALNLLFWIGACAAIIYWPE